MHPSLYSCPVCSDPLNLKDNSWHCDNGHQFDVHKKGYVNLLLSNHKRSKNPGDDALMIESRRRFLHAGHYQPLAEQISTKVAEFLSPESCVLDAGCGEGYYTDYLAANQPKSYFYGLDISKPAINAAARNKAIQWCVASSTRAPYLEQQFDAIISVFSRIDADSFHRIMKPEGVVAIAAPDHDHLTELRRQLYAQVSAYDTSKHLSYLDDRFTLVDETRVEAPLSLETNQAITDLVRMTPHQHKISSDAKSRIESLDQLNDTACFKLYLFKKGSE
ncbi:putative RNA methyltransferase [Reinekea thalattae]|uniref:Methyltransferase domain-containing protein n=1 Tax=Reinekea thalattae TaxID=2593301 RepID=A0A5C8ZBS6_9GAMM|nr:methyltransferase domain-containing protein [Reinekea thalattae]TXR54270.1 methyltransferase domain-containing protein [Reinekea thalattae]